jgi:hypothetical protein
MRINTVPLAACVRCIALLLGLILGVPAFAQTTGGIVVSNAIGTVRYRIGDSEPQTAVNGQTIPVGARIVTGTNSSVVLTFPDGQIVAMGPKSRLIIRQYRYVPGDIDKSLVILNVTDGGVRMVLGAIGQRDPGLIQLQIGLKTTAQTPNLPRTGDLGMIMLGNATVIQVNEGRVALRVAGETYPLASGESALVQADGFVVLGGPARLESRPGQSTDDKAMFDQFRDMQKLILPVTGVQTMLTLATPPYDEKRDEDYARAEQIPPQPVTNSLSTMGTGATGGGAPCTASCN